MLKDLIVVIKSFKEGSYLILTLNWRDLVTHTHSLACMCDYCFLYVYFSQITLAHFLFLFCWVCVCVLVPWPTHCAGPHAQHQRRWPGKPWQRCAAGCQAQLHQRNFSRGVSLVMGFLSVPLIQRTLYIEAMRWWGVRGVGRPAHHQRK